LRRARTYPTIAVEADVRSNEADIEPLMTEETLRYEQLSTFGKIGYNVGLFTWGIAPGTTLVVGVLVLQALALLALDQRWLGVQLLGPLLLTAAVVVWMRRTSNWLVLFTGWLDELATDPEARSWNRRLLLSTALLLLGLFTAWTTFYYQRGWLGTGETSHPFLRIEEDYLWHLVDAVPALNATKTLHWHEPAVVDTTRSGVLLLTFKILVVIPLLAAVLSMLAASLRYGNKRPGDDGRDA
jgi:hypothetical protein